MTKGRKIGQTDVTMSDVQQIIELTKKGCFRSEIAHLTKRSKDTVYRYQKKYKII